MFRDVAKLIAVVKTQDPDGYPVEAEAKTDTYVNVKSATRAEFYTALQAGLTISKVFEMRACDYADQKRIEYDGRVYNIIRTYTKDGEVLELNCSDLAV